ncbi:MAG TPA: YDG domain-containing protein, partial [Sphingobacterium sp.]|nr:YDG domain-containing protein [Sphingobacterium sp.]
MRLLLAFVFNIVFFLNGVSQTPNANGVLYVKKGSGGTGDSWANAVGELSEALRFANENTAIKEIWVSQDTYYPKYNEAYQDNVPSSRKLFILPDGIKLYGGFYGTELTKEDRDGSSAYTVVSGDHLRDDSPVVDYPKSDIQDNSNHLFVICNNEQEIVIDRFRIEHGGSTEAVGYTNGDLFFEKDNLRFHAYRGGGVYIQKGRLRLENIRFFNNYSRAEGGGICAIESELTIANSVFEKNFGETGIGSAFQADNKGGGIYADRCNLQLDRVQFEVNQAANGAAIFMLEGVLLARNVGFRQNFGISSGALSFKVTDATLRNIIGVGNTTLNKGGVIYCEGSNVKIEEGEFLRNETLYENGTYHGGAIYGKESVLKIGSAVFDQNRAGDKGGSIYMEKGDLTVTASNFIGNVAQRGGAVYLQESEGSFQRCTFKNNESTYINGDGGAISALSAYGREKLYVSESNFEGNKAAWTGGGINFAGYELIVETSVFKNNSGNWRGGAIHALTGTIVRCQFYNNYSIDGSAFGGQCELMENCIFAFNKGRYAISSNIFVFEDRAYGKIVNSTFYGNEGVNLYNGNREAFPIYNSYLGKTTDRLTHKPKVFNCFVETDEYLDGILVDDPLFVDPQNLDFRLLPKSPLIDEGVNSYFVGLDESSVDLDGEPRVYNYPNGIIDIGAYEFEGEGRIARFYTNVIYGSQTEGFVQQFPSIEDFEFEEMSSAIAEYMEALDLLISKDVGPVVIEGEGIVDGEQKTIKIYITIQPKEIYAELVGELRKEYDGHRNGNLTDGNIQIVGAIDGDDVYFHVDNTSFEYDDKNVGVSKQVTFRSAYLVLQGTDSRKYIFDFNDTEELRSDQGVIYAKELLVRVLDVEKTYDGKPYTDFSVAFFGFALAESVGDLGGSLEFEGPGTDAIDVGQYEVEVKGAFAVNYTIEYEVGMITIVLKELEIRVEDISVCQHEDVQQGDIEIRFTSFVEGEDASVLSAPLTVDISYIDFTVPGTYDLIASPIEAKNYRVTYMKGALTVDALPYVELVLDKEEITSGEIFSLRLDGAERYQVFVDDRLVKETNHNYVELTLAQSGLVKVIGFNGDCTHEAERYIDVLQIVEPEYTDLFFPNVITPNGDGLNDTFKIRGLLDEDYIMIVVFRSDGKEVYANLRYDNNW